MILEYSDHGYNTRNSNALKKPFSSVKQIEINYEYQYISKWNQLSRELTNLSSLKILKKK